MLERMRNTDGWVATAAWTGGLASLLIIVTGGVWTALLVANLATTPAPPWAAGAMALVLWAMWSYLAGKWWPDRTRGARRRYLRARRLPGRVFTWALLAGALSVVSLAGLWIVMFRLVRIPGNTVPDLSKYPVITVVAIVAMAFAGVIGCGRGRFPRLLPGRVGIAFPWPVRSVDCCSSDRCRARFDPGILMAHGAVFYFLVDTMLGTSAYLKQSILQGLVVNTFPLLIFFGLVWPQDRQRELIWAVGADTWFWIHVAQAVVFAGLGIISFVHLARLAERRHGMAH